MFGNMLWYGVLALPGLLPTPGLVRAGENRLLGLRGNLSGSGLGEVSAGEEEEEELLTELSDDKLRREEMEEIGEKADFSLDCCMRLAW